MCNELYSSDAVKKRLKWVDSKQVKDVVNREVMVVTLLPSFNDELEAEMKKNYPLYSENCTHNVCVF